jgi:hypothetical protein
LGKKGIAGGLGVLNFDSFMSKSVEGSLLRFFTQKSNRQASLNSLLIFTPSQNPALALKFLPLFRITQLHMIQQPPKTQKQVSRHKRNSDAFPPFCFSRALNLMIIPSDTTTPLHYYINPGSPPPQRWIQQLFCSSGIAPAKIAVN